jgi:aspartate racemase
MKSEKTIGVVGGIGSYAGIDLIRKVFDLTEANTDQEHLSVIMISEPSKIADRTAFLLGETDINPGIKISEIIGRLVSAGAEVIGIPCNTAHSKSIYSQIKKNVPHKCKLINLIEETGIWLSGNYPEINRAGLLATNGTLFSNIYPDTLSKYEIEVIYPSDEIQKNCVHPSIYSKEYGIKSYPNPVSQQALDQLNTASNELIEAGAEAIILGCSEISYALGGRDIGNIPLVDTTSVLASALIREARGGDEA